MPPKASSFTHFPKNTSANRLESHTFKTKDLKPFRFIHFQKSGGGAVVWVCLFAIQHLTSNLRPSLNPVASTLTRKLHLKPFRINTYKKQGEGGGGIPAFDSQLSTVNAVLPSNSSASSAVRHFCYARSREPG